MNVYLITLQEKNKEVWRKNRGELALTGITS